MKPQATAVSPDPELTVVDSPPSPAEAPKREHRGHGKIAQLPKALRDQVNDMLDNGFPYARIIEKLQASDPPLPYAISEMNLSRWKDNGYQRYLAKQECLAGVRMNREDALEMVAQDDTITLPEATLQIIASQYYELLGEFSPDSLKAKLAEDPLKYTRFLNVFARLTREILNLKKHRQACAAAAASEVKKPDPNRQISESEFELFAKKAEGFFNVKLARPLLPQNPAPPTAPPEPPGKNGHK